MALMEAPVTPSMATIGSGFDVAVIGMRASTTAPTTASRRNRSIVGREPMRAMTMPPQIAPATPPRLKAPMPLLATVRPRPAPGEHRRHPVEGGIDGEHAREHRAPEGHRVAAEIGVKSAPTDARATAFSPRSTKRLPAGTAWPIWPRIRSSSGQRSVWRARNGETPAGIA